ncbi:(2Fe-2S)-binding protein [Streptomyces iconiensis]|uniref:Ferric siderophore reductase C-terminal domain-containing protein n=1 Tax=Streptomyces iconiensis TaxID=1384038 RepID=A0ABT7A0S8_9ACTN|nr:hypothetical protein [Streptomyces iconiensis]MDJ1134441.1 hypothetical protein [Streptomyces iconiensis]
MSEPLDELDELDELEALVALTDLASAHGPRYHLLPGEPPRKEAGAWLPADRLHSPGSPELAHLLRAEYDSSGHRTAHAAALTLIAVYAGRVTAAAVLHWALDGRVWDMRPANVLVRPAAHGIGGVRLREARLLAPAGDRTRTLPVLHEAVLHTHLLPLAEALHRETRAGLRQLRGGIAHGCATALGAATTRDPRELADRWAEFIAPLPGLARLGNVAEVTRADGTRRLHYLRNTCCLFYTSAEDVRCASCCLTPREERLSAYASQ